MATHTLPQTGIDAPLASRTALRRWLLIGSVLLALVLGAGAAWWAVGAADEAARIKPGVTVAGVAVGQMKPAEAEAALHQQFYKLLDSPVELRFGKRTWSYPARTLGVALDVPTLAAAAYDAGRKPGSTVTATIPLAFTHNRSQAEPILHELTVALAVRPIDAQLDPTADGVVVRSAVTGQELDADATWQAIVDATNRPPFSPAAVAVIPVAPLVSDSVLKDVSALAHRLSDQPLVLTATLDGQVKTWTLDPPTLREMVVISKDAQGRATVSDQLDGAQLQTHLQGMAAEIDRTARDARLDLPDFQTTVRLTPDVTARELDLPTSLRRIQAAAGADGAARTIPLAVIETPATVRASTLLPIKERLDKVMGTGINLHYDTQLYHVAGDRLALFIYLDAGETGSADTYTVRVDDAGMGRLAQAIAKDLSETPQEVRYRQVSGAVTVFQQPKDGRAVEVDGTAAHLKAAILAGQTEADLVWHVVHPNSPAVDTATILTPDLLASGSTDYRNSSAERNWNVTFGASKLDGWYIAPGATFSLNDALGPLTLDAGFKMGWAILVESGNATTIPSEAGGICQVATTLYHSVFWTGLPISEYHHHSYWINSYGQPPDGLKGLDATISPPWSDFQFRNTTGNWLLIRAIGDKKTLTVQLYGSSPGWEVQVTPPVITDVVPTDHTARNETSDKLPAGKKVMVEHAQDGFTSLIVREVRKDGVVVDHWEAKNTYLPAHDTYVTGTGKDVPTPGPTATATPKPKP